MSTKDPAAKESVGESAKTVHLVCHECPEAEELLDSEREAEQISNEHENEFGHETSVLAVES